MKTETAKKEFENCLKKSGIQLSNLTPASGIQLMLDFYRNVRAEKCNLDEDGDMLLFQWGTYDWGKGPSFQCNITRQFIATDCSSDPDDSVMSQLSLTFHFPPSEEFNRIESSNRWCNNPGDLMDFQSFIVSTESYRAVADKQPSRVTLDYGEV